MLDSHDIALSLLYIFFLIGVGGLSIIRLVNFCSYVNSSHPFFVFPLVENRIVEFVL